MGSNFGGDGGDTIVDPNNGCNIAAEYVYLALSGDEQLRRQRRILDHRPDRRCPAATCPTGQRPWADAERRGSSRRSLADPRRTSTPGSPAATHVWIQHPRACNIQSGGGLDATVFDLGAGHVGHRRSATSGGMVVRRLVRPLQQQSASPAASPSARPTGPAGTQLNLPVDGTILPNRFVSGFERSTRSQPQPRVRRDQRLLAVKWTEGPGAGIGHVFESTDTGTTWKDISANLPDIPTNHMVVTAGGSLIAGTDLGVVVRPAGSTTWSRLGTNLPTTTVTDLEVGPNGLLYVATHGRGQWSTRLGRLA